MPDVKVKPSYGPILLALGKYMEEQNWRDICVLEVEGGMIIQGIGLLPTAEGYQYVIETKMFNHDELAKMMGQRK